MKREVEFPDLKVLSAEKLTAVPLARWPKYLLENISEEIRDCARHIFKTDHSVMESRLCLFEKLHEIWSESSGAVVS